MSGTKGLSDYCSQKRGQIADMVGVEMRGLVIDTASTETASPYTGAWWEQFFERRHANP